MRYFGAVTVFDVFYLAAVNTYEPGKSPYGVYHMAGNVLEWVADWHEDDYYTKSPQRDPRGPASGQYRVLRGGSWMDQPGYVRSAYRLSVSPSSRIVTFCFRCARAAPQ